MEISYAKMLQLAVDFFDGINSDVASLGVSQLMESDGETQDENELFTVGGKVVDSLSEIVRAIYRYNEFSKALGFPIAPKAAFNAVRVMRNYVEHVKSEVPVFYVPSGRKSIFNEWDMFVDIVSVLSELRSLGMLMDEEAMKSLEKSSYNLGGYLNLSNAIEAALDGALNDYNESVASEMDSLSESSRSSIEEGLELAKDDQDERSVKILKFHLRQDEERQLLSGQNLQLTKSWLA